MPKHAKTVAKKNLEMKASSQKEISKAVNVPECCEMLLSREELEKRKQEKALRRQTTTKRFTCTFPLYSAKYQSGQNKNDVQQ